MTAQFDIGLSVHERRAQCERRGQTDRRIVGERRADGERRAAERRGFERRGVGSGGRRVPTDPWHRLGSAMVRDGGG
jgi:hypothetical protein